MGWRNDIAVIRYVVTGTHSEGWQKDILEIVNTQGYSSNNPRSAVRKWANSKGISVNEWRTDVMSIAFSITGIKPNSWRQGWHYMRLFYDGNPPKPPIMQTSYFLTSAGEYFVLTDGKKLSVKG